MGCYVFQLALAAAATALASTPTTVEAFAAASRGASRMLHLGQRHHLYFSGRSANQRRAILGMKYVPDGLTPEQWKKMQKEEAEKKKKMGNLGQVGVKSFKSRSLQAWQEDGAGHLFPVDPRKVKSGEVAVEKVPYMQRKGAWDNSDLVEKNVKSQQTNKPIVKRKWSNTDKAYAEKPTKAAETKAAAQKAAAGKKPQLKTQRPQQNPKLKPEETKKGLFGLW